MMTVRSLYLSAGVAVVAGAGALFWLFGHVPPEPQSDQVTVSPVIQTEVDEQLVLQLGQLQRNMEQLSATLNHLQGQVEKLSTEPPKPPEQWEQLVARITELEAVSAQAQLPELAEQDPAEIEAMFDTPEAEQERVREMLDQLDQTFVADPVDQDWSYETSAQIDQLLASEALETFAEGVSHECRASLCRIGYRE